MCSTTLHKPANTILGRYDLETKIGSGRYSTIWAGWDRQLSRRVAVKLLHPEHAGSAEAKSRMRREARLMARLQNEHVPNVLDQGTLPDGRSCIVMDLLDGESLEDLLSRQKTISPELAVAYTLHACIALAEAHRIGAVHRDIKPDNLFVSRLPDGSHVVKVIDFGIAWLEDDDDHATILGTPLYMAPECLEANARPDPRTDIWAIGAVLHEALLGVAPYDAPTVAAVLKRLQDGEHAPIANHPGLPKGLGDVIDMCLRRAPDERFQNVVALAFALVDFAAPADRRLAARVERLARPLPRTTHLGNVMLERRVEPPRVVPLTPAPALEPKATSRPSTAPWTLTESTATPWATPPARPWRSVKRHVLGSMAAAALFTTATMATIGAAGVAWGGTLATLPSRKVPLTTQSIAVVAETVAPPPASAKPTPPAPEAPPSAPPRRIESTTPTVATPTAAPTSVAAEPASPEELTQEPPLANPYDDMDDDAAFIEHEDIYAP